MAKSRRKYESFLKRDLTNKFIECLEQEELPWHAGWKMSRMYNPITKVAYKGLNRMRLAFETNEKGYTDNRWMTEKQAKEKGYTIKEPMYEHKVALEYYYYRKVKDKIPGEKNNSLTIREYHQLCNSDPDEASKYKFTVNGFWVFNAENIIGIPEIESNNEVLDIDIQEKLNAMITNMKVNVDESLTCFQPCYYSTTDTVSIPPKNMFESNEEYLATLMHEIGHSTGHISRLNRDMSGVFGSEKYAIEELRVEIASAFNSEFFGYTESEKVIENHKAYIQSWAKAIRKDKEILMTAIKEAEKISEYMVEMAEISIPSIEQIEEEESETEDEMEM